jgi:uncharacterized membrane-anchored protein YhcB (DUF1043 family)
MQIIQSIRSFFDAATSLRSLWIYGGIALVAIGVYVLIGCEPKVQIPGRIADQMNVDTELPLKTARTLLEDFRAESERRVAEDAADLERLSGSIHDAEVWQANMSAVLWGAIDTAAGQAQAIPGANLVLPSLFALLGLFLPKPGTQKKIDAAYDAGRGETLTTLAMAHSNNKVA